MYHLLITFSNTYNEVYEQFEQVYIIQTQPNILFEITNKEKYRFFKVSDFNKDYETLIRSLFERLPFHFDHVKYLNQDRELYSMELTNTYGKYDPSEIQLVVAYYNENLSF